MAIKVKDYKLPNGNIVNDANIKVRQITLYVDVFDKDMTVLLAKDKKTVALGPNSSSVFGTNMYAILKKNKTIGDYEDVLKDNLWVRFKRWIKKVLGSK